MIWFLVAGVAVTAATLNLWGPPVTRLLERAGGPEPTPEPEPETAGLNWRGVAYGLVFILVVGSAAGAIFYWLAGL